MKSVLNIFLVFILTASVGTLQAVPSNGDRNSVEYGKAVSTVEKAARALDNVMEDPMNGIPHSLINNSEGIVIFPGATQVAAGPFNGPGGKGIAMIHSENGSWSSPFFVTLREGSTGFQFSAETSDIILLFKDRNDMVNIDKAEITLGGDIGVEEGPVNNGSFTGTENAFEAEIYSYHRINGLLTGISLNGGILSYYERLSDTLYSTEAIKMDKLIYADLSEIKLQNRINPLLHLL